VAVIIKKIALLQNYRIPLKVIALVLIFSGIFYFEELLYNFAISTSVWWIEIAICLAQCLILLLVGFSFFQFFKYVRFPRGYYLKRAFETDRYFTFAGVKIYRFILINSFLRYANRRVYIKGRKREYIKILYEETRQSETSHWVTIVPTLYVQILYLTNGDFPKFLYLTLFSIFFNFYPILLQRKNRFHLEARFKSLI